MDLDWETHRVIIGLQSRWLGLAGIIDKAPTDEARRFVSEQADGAWLEYAAACRARGVCLHVGCWDQVEQARAHCKQHAEP